MNQWTSKMWLCSTWIPEHEAQKANQCHQSLWDDWDDMNTIASARHHNSWSFNSCDSAVQNESLDHANSSSFQHTSTKDDRFTSDRQALPLLNMNGHHKKVLQHLTIEPIKLDVTGMTWHQKQIHGVGLMTNNFAAHVPCGCYEASTQCKPQNTAKPRSVSRCFPVASTSKYERWQTRYQTAYKIILFAEFALYDVV